MTPTRRKKKRKKERQNELCTSNYSRFFSDDDNNLNNEMKTMPSAQKKQKLAKRKRSIKIHGKERKDKI